MAVTETKLRASRTLSGCQHHLPRWEWSVWAREISLMGRMHQRMHQRGHQDTASLSSSSGLFASRIECARWQDLALIQHELRVVRRQTLSDTLAMVPLTQHMKRVCELYQLLGSSPQRRASQLVKKLVGTACTPKLFK